jgi:hypothetical protein
VTIVMAVSFMVAAPFSLGVVVVRFDRIAVPISSVAAESFLPIHSAPFPNQQSSCGIARIATSRNPSPR